MPGRSKLSRSWGDTTVAGAVVRTARQAGLAPLIVTVRAGARPPRGAGRADAFAEVPPRGGRAESLSAGLAACPPGPVVVLLGDEPGMEIDLVRRFVDLCRAEEADAGRVQYVDRPGHPVWLGPAGRLAVAGLRGDAAIWDRFARSSLRITILTAEASAPIDVDSPEALARARAVAAGRDEPERGTA
jgi:molybdenum cofactor cytidylyltransferase